MRAGSGAGGDRRATRRRVRRDPRVPPAPPRTNTRYARASSHLGTLSRSRGRRSAITPALCIGSMFCGRVASSATVCTKVTRSFWYFSNTCSTARVDAAGRCGWWASRPAGLCAHLPRVRPSVTPCRTARPYSRRTRLAQHSREPKRNGSMIPNVSRLAAICESTARPTGQGSSRTTLATRNRAQILSHVSYVNLTPNT